MRRAVVWIVAITIVLCLSTSLASAQVSQTAFTYQGQLKDEGSGVNAESARFDFRLWNADVGGAQIGSDYVAYPVAVVDGVFTALLDFGGTAFDGQGRWLEIGVDVTGGTSYAWLSPRQAVTATPYALHAHAPWRMVGSDLYFDSGKVGIGTASPAYPLDVISGSATRVISGTSTDLGAGRIGVYGECRTTNGSGVQGTATASSGSPAGVRGDASSPDGIGVRGYAGYPSGGTPTGVYGSVRYSGGIGVKGVNSASSGDGIGVYGEATSSTGFGGYFLGRGYFSGRLGVGTSSPASELDVSGTVTMSGLRMTHAPQDGYVLTADATGLGTWEAPASGGIGGSGSANYLPKFTGTTSLGNSIVYETALGNVGIGTTSPLYPLDVQGTVRVNGFKLASSPQEGYVLTSDASGMGTWRALASAYWQPGTGSAIYYSAGNVGINTSTPSQRLDVAGTARMTGFLLPTSAQNGYVLTSDASGVGTWQAAAGGLTLPYSGTVSSTNPAFQVTNTGTGATSWAFKGTSSGDGCAYFYCDKVGGFGVKAVAASGDESNASRGGWFISNAYTGHGVEAEANGPSATAVVATASGSSGCGVRASANGTNGVGLYASGSRQAAQLYGNVAIYEFGTSNKVIELGKGLDYAEGFDVSPSEETVTPGTVLVIDPQHPGRLTRCEEAYDRRVAGIVAGAKNLGSGVRLGSEFDHDVALAGRVYCNVIALSDDIQPGDLLTTSSVPGYAMKVRDHARAQGAVLGKAMEPLRKGERGQILVLVTLQ